MTDIARIQNIFKHFNAEWTILIRRSTTKELQYTALGKEVSIHSDTDVNTVITLIRDMKKMVLRIKWDDVSDMERVIALNMGFIDVITPDNDVSVVSVSDRAESDERKFHVSDIDASFLHAQWEVVKNYPYDEHISIEGFSYVMEEEEKEFINSLGAYKRHATTHSMYSLELYYESEAFSDVYADYRFSEMNAPVDPEFIDNTHEHLLQRSRPAVPSITSGMYTVTLENTVVASFLEILSDALAWEGLRQRTSFFSTGDIGKLVLDPRLTVRSNPSRPHSPFNRLFDGEGVTSEVIELVRDGVLQNVFLDSKNAKKLGLPHTGKPRPANLEVVSTPSDDYLKNSRFLFTELMAFHTVDSISGKFALEGEGFEIIDGKKGNYIKNVSLSGNVRDLFSSIESFGPDIYTDANIFTPSITFREQTVVV